MLLRKLQVTSLAQRDDHDEHERHAAHQSRRHEPGAQKRGMPHLATLLQTEDPSGDRVNEHGAHQSDGGHHAQSSGRALAALEAQHSPQIHDGQDQVRAQHDDVPHQRRAEIGVHEQLPKAQRLAEVDHDEADRQHRAADGGPHGDLRHAAETLHAEHARSARDDKAAGGQTDEEHEHRDVKPPRVQIAHVGVHHAAGQLKCPQSQTADGENGRHHDGDSNPFAAESGSGNLGGLLRRYVLRHDQSPYTR